jgi:hypothetical protein
MIAPDVAEQKKAVFSVSSTPFKKKFEVTIMYTSDIMDQIRFAAIYQTKIYNILKNAAAAVSVLVH